MNKPKIIIKELKNSIIAGETDDIWACIQIKSEKENLDVEFQLEALMIDWDTRKLQAYWYLNALLRWEKIAKANNFDFEVESHISIKDEPITL